MSKRKNHGGAVIEFFLVLPFLTSLIIGTLVYGTQIVKELQLQQVVRDTASMAARGTVFIEGTSHTDTGAQAIVSRLGAGLNWPSSGGLLSTSPGVVYVSVIMYLDAGCNTGTACANKNSWVFVNSVSFGNTGLRGSNFGAQASCTPGCWDTNRNDGSLTSTAMLTDVNAKVKNFTLLGTPATATDGFKPGQYAYLVEAAATTSPFNGGTIGYAFSLF
jgi:Flp pilus assembly protein TadG